MIRVPPSVSPPTLPDPVLTFSILPHIFFLFSAIFSGCRRQASHPVALSAFCKILVLLQEVFHFNFSGCGLAVAFRGWTCQLLGFELQGLI